MFKNNLTYNIYCFHNWIVLLISVYGTVNAQVVVQFTSSNDNNLNFQSIWNFQVNNLSGPTITSYIEIKITNASTEPVVVIQSPRFELVEGLNTPSYDIIKNAKIDYNKNNQAATILKKEEYFPQGLYYICIVVKDAKSDAEIGQNCTQANITFEPVKPKNEKTDGKKDSFLGKHVKFSGHTEITGVYSNMQPLGSTTPPSYLQWYLNPTLSVYDFPVSFQLLLSTRQTDTQQNINSFNVQFDAQQFKQMLMQRAIAFAQDKILKDKLGNLNLETFTSQFNTIKGKLESPGALLELGQIKQLDSLKNSLSDLQNMKLDSAGIFNQLRQLKKLTGNDSLSLDTSMIRAKMDSFKQQGDSLMKAKTDSLKKKIKVLSWLEEKKPYYDKLMKQKDELEAHLKGLNIDSLTGKIDEFSSKYDVKKFNDPNYLYGFLDKFKLFRKFEKVMTAVKTLSIGTSYPNYSDFTFRGVQLNGFNIELEKWNTYIGFIFGTALQGIMPSNLQGNNNNVLYTYKRNVIGGSAGYGSKEKSHIHFTLLSFDDDPTSIYIPDSMIGMAPRPQSNQVMSTDFKLQLFKKKISIYGELAGAQTIRDITLIDSTFMINITNYNNPREWFSNIFLQKDVDLNTSVDFAFKAGAEATLFKGLTKISTQVKRVGPGFYSFGNPFMMRDMFNIEAKVSQAFWKNRIKLSGFIRRNIDNLEQTKLLTSQLYNFGFDFSLNIPKWPSLKIAMTPYVQSNDSMNMNINVLIANTNYICKIKKTQLLSNLTYMHQNGTAADSSMNFYSHYITLLNTLLISKTVSVNITQNYFLINNRYGKVGTYALNASGTVVAFKRWNNSIGTTISFNENERRYGGYYQTSIQFLKYFTFNIRAEYSRYDVINYTANNINIPFDQVNIRGILTTKW